MPNPLNELVLVPHELHNEIPTSSKAMPNHSTSWGVHSSITVEATCRHHAIAPKKQCVVAASRNLGVNHTPLKPRDVTLAVIIGAARNC